MWGSTVTGMGQGRRECDVGRAAEVGDTRGMARVDIWHTVYGVMYIWYKVFRVVYGIRRKV